MAVIPNPVRDRDHRKRNAPSSRRGQTTRENGKEPGMELPIDLKIAIEKQIRELDYAALKRDSQTLSERYRTRSGQGRRLLTRHQEAAAYAVARMPATYGAVFTALSHALPMAPRRPKTVLDAGAGTGAASWAAHALLDIESLVCLERESAMMRMGQTLMAEAPPPLCAAKWLRHDLTAENIPVKADLVIASYVLNEMREAERAEAIEKLWHAAEVMLLLVEPGTPAGYALMMDARRRLLQMGAHLAAPCPHESACPMPPDDWCHFRCRVPRSRLHRQLKDGTAPYEDEKFAYLAVTREPCRRADARIVRHPLTDKGKIALELCTVQGMRKMDVHKKDGDLYKRARKAKCGDEWKMERMNGDDGDRTDG